MKAEKSIESASQAAKQGVINKIKDNTTKYLKFHIAIFNKIKDRISIHKNPKIKKKEHYEITIVLSIFQTVD